MWISHCYCSICRKQTGALVGTYVGFPAGSVRWAAAEPARYRSSKDAERSFCSKCGGTIGFHRVHETSLTAGSFDDPGGLMFEGEDNDHVWCQERVSWFHVSDDWPRHDRFPPGRNEELEDLSGKTFRG
jgi:hypothetical protein